MIRTTRVQCRHYQGVQAQPGTQCLPCDKRTGPLQAHAQLSTAHTSTCLPNDMHTVSRAQARHCTHACQMIHTHTATRTNTQVCLKVGEPPNNYVFCFGFPLQRSNNKMHINVWGHQKIGSFVRCSGHHHPERNPSPVAARGHRARGNPQHLGRKPQEALEMEMRGTPWLKCKGEAQNRNFNFNHTSKKKHASLKHGLGSFLFLGKS